MAVFVLNLPLNPHPPTHFKSGPDIAKNSAKQELSGTASIIYLWTDVSRDLNLICIKPKEKVAYTIRSMLLQVWKIK